MLVLSVISTVKTAVKPPEYVPVLVRELEQQFQGREVVGGLGNAMRAHAGSLRTVR